MDIKMDPYRLLSDELSYELMIRGIVATGIVAEKRSRLRDCLRAGPDEASVMDIPLDPKEALDTCNKKLKELAKFLEDFDTSKYQLEYARIGSRLTHVHKRLSRISEPKYKDQVERLNVKCEDYIGQLRIKFTSQASAHLLAEQANAIDDPDDAGEEPTTETKAETVITAAESIEARLAAALEKISLSFGEPSRRTYMDKSSFPVHKWNVKYDGESGLSNFLERVDELSSPRGITKQQLFASAVELFTGNALTWFRAKRNTFSTWEQLTTALRETFLPCDYEFNLWDEIRNRTQGNDEKVSIFIANMEGLFNRLRAKPVETERIIHIRRNLQPYLQHRLGLQDIRTVNELDLLCSQLEDIQARTQRLKAPPLVGQSLEPDLAYHRPRSSPRIAAAEFDPNPDVDAIAAPNRPSMTCWNCQGQGHRSTDCSEQRRKHCYRCGRPNFTTRDCPRCSGNVNARH